MGRSGEGGVTGLLQTVVAAMAIAHGAVAQPMDDGSGRGRLELHASSQVGRSALFAAQSGGLDDEPLDGEPVDLEPVAQDPIDTADEEALDQGSPPDDDEDLDQGPAPAASSAIDEEPLDQGPPPTTSAPPPAATSTVPVQAAPPAAPAPVVAPAAIPAEPTGGKPIVSSPKPTWPFDDGGGVFVNAGFGPGEASAEQGFDSCKQRVSNGRAYVGVNCSGADVVSGFTPPPWLVASAEAAQTVIRPASALSLSEWQPGSSPSAANTANAAESTNDGNTVYKEGKSRTRTRTVTINEDGDTVAEDDRGNDDNGAATRSDRSNRNESAQAATNTNETDNRGNGNNRNNGGNDNGGKASSQQKSGKADKNRTNASKKKDRRADRKKARKQDRRAERQEKRQDERRADQQDRRASAATERGSTKASQRAANNRAECRNGGSDDAGKRNGDTKDRQRACRSEARTASDS